MNKSLLERARNYENEKVGVVPSEQRPMFHMSVPIGWMNDPNGFSEYKGEVHLFYQYYPYEKKWGPMHWGHVKTQDFIKWKYLPAALAPDEDYDSAGVFSGSALEEQGKQILMYTGVEEVTLSDGRKEVRQNQCIAIGDGTDYEKLKDNPVITADELPKGSSLEDFRDPKLWKEEDVYYAVIGSRHQDGSGQIAMFCSRNLKDWEFCSILARCKNQYGRMWECPDFFRLGGKSVLMVSPQEMVAEGLEFHDGNGTMFLYGTYDKVNKKLDRDGIQAVDYGLDFYASQTMGTADGRRIMIAWMKSWDTNLSPDEFQWSAMMTIPRELEYRNGRIVQNPIREIEKYYSNKVKYASVQFQGEKTLEGIKGRSMDMTVEIKSGDYSEFQIELASNGELYSRLIYDRKKQVLTFDRTHSGHCRDIVNSCSMYVKEKEEGVKLRIVMDKYSVEVFANDGEQAMTSLVYTKQEADAIRFLSDGNVCISVVKYDIITF